MSDREKQLLDLLSERTRQKWAAEDERDTMRRELLALASWCDEHRSSPTTADLRAIAAAASGIGSHLTVRADSLAWRGES